MINRIVGAAVLLTVLMTSLLSAQENCVTGKVVDADNPDQVLVGATVQLLMNDTFVAGTVTDFDGAFIFCGKPDSGFYSLQIDYTGYPEKRIIDMPADTNSLVISMEEGVILHMAGYSISCGPPMYNADDMGSGQTFTDEQVMRGSPYYQNGGYVTHNTPRQQRRRKRRARRKAARKKRRQ